MKPRISLITLGVDDLEASLRFYRDGLGLETQGIIGTEFEYGAVAFFDLQANLKLALYPRKSLAKDSGLPIGTPNALEFNIGHNVSSKAEVNQVMAQAKDAGLLLQSLPKTPFGAVTQVTSKTPMVTSGKLHGTPNGLSQNKA